MLLVDTRSVLSRSLTTQSRDCPTGCTARLSSLNCLSCPWPVAEQLEGRSSVDDKG
jgi:hypothetical protein